MRNVWSTWKDYHDELNSFVRKAPDDTRLYFFGLSCIERNMPNFAEFQRSSGRGNLPELLFLTDELWNLDLSSAADLMRAKVAGATVITNVVDLVPYQMHEGDNVALHTAAQYLISMLDMIIQYVANWDAKLIIGIAEASTNTVVEKAFFDASEKFTLEKGRDWVKASLFSANVQKQIKQLRINSFNEGIVQAEIAKQMETIAFLRAQKNVSLELWRQLRAASLVNGQSNLGYELRSY